MAFHVRDKETDAMVREVARLRGEGLTESIRAVFGEELKRREAEVSGRDRGPSPLRQGRHAARLNMGDCFAYACARTHNASLLFKGDDFALTDVVGA